VDAESQARQAIEKAVDLLENRGVTKYAVLRNVSSISISLPNEPESSVQRYFEEFSRTDAAFRDPRDHHTIIIEIKSPGSERNGREDLVRALKAEENELRQRGVASLLLFGSAAVAGSQPNDVDLLARYRPDIRLSAFDVAGIQLYLEDRLGRRVDLSNEKSFPAAWKSQVERSGIRIFDS
jgi:predicted nucleotidyltransferase